MRNISDTEQYAITIPTTTTMAGPTTPADQPLRDQSMSANSETTAETPYTQLNTPYLPTKAHNPNRSDKSFTARTIITPKPNNPSRTQYQFNTRHREANKSADQTAPNGSNSTVTIRT